MNKNKVSQAEIPAASSLLRGVLVDGLYPGYVTDKEEIALTVPWSDEQDYQVGIFLYDIQDTSALRPEFSVRNGSERAWPPMAVELSYLVFCNENKQFGGIKRERTQLLLNECIRIIHDNPVIRGGNKEPLQLSFARPELELKLRLWSSFQKPLQPAVYVKAVPLLIASGRSETAPAVKERDYQVNPHNR